MTKSKSRQVVANDLRKSGKTLQYIGDVLGVTRERARQIIEDKKPELVSKKNHQKSKEPNYPDRERILSINAEQYAKQFLATDQTNSFIIDIMNDIFKKFWESKDKEILVKSHMMLWHNAEEKSLVPVWPIRVLNELDGLWHRFVNIVNDANNNSNLYEDGFENILKKHYPEIWGHWITIRTLHG